MKILIADDNEDIIETTQMVLELDGHEVHGVTLSQDIRSEVQAKQPDVLLQDINMPGLDLLGLLEHMDATRVLLFSGATPEQELLDHPAVVGFVPKPFVIAVLRERLAELQ